MQGLDYVSAEGAKAFDELAAVIENLGVYGKGLSWAKSQYEKLKQTKRYLKGGFKVGLLKIRCIIKLNTSHVTNVYWCPRLYMLWMTSTYNIDI